MKIVSYNINGIRASAKLGLIEWIKNFDADVYCFQEVRANENVTKEILYPKTSQLSLFGEEDNNNILKDYFPIYNCGEIAGYRKMPFYMYLLAFRMVSAYPDTPRNSTDFLLRLKLFR